MSNTQDNTYNALAGKDNMEDAVQQVKETVADAKENVEVAAEESKGMLAGMLSAVSNTVSSVVDSAASLTHKVMDAALGVKDVAVEKTSEVLHNPTVEPYVEASKEKAAAISAAATDALAAGQEKVSALTEQYAGDYIKAGKEKAGSAMATGMETASHMKEVAQEKASQMAEAAKETLHNHPVVEGYVNAGIEKASAAVAAAGEYVPVLKAKAGEAVEQASEKMSEKKEEVKEAAKEVKPKVSEKKEEAKELLAQTRGDEVDITGHIAVAPENVKEAKESEYVGGWEKVEKGGHHHPAEPTTAAPAK